MASEEIEEAPSSRKRALEEDESSPNAKRPAPEDKTYGDSKVLSSEFNLMTDARFEGLDKYAAAEIRICVSPGIVGLLIGSRGETIKSLCTQAGAQLKVLQGDEFPGIEERVVLVKGTVLGVNSGIQKLLEKLIEMKALTTGPNDAYVVKALIPNHMTGFLIGRGGENVRQYEADSAAVLQFAPDRQVQPGAVYRNLVTTGTTQAVRVALMLIVAKMNKYFGVYGGSANDSLTSSVVAVPQRHVGLVIGKKGETLRSLERESGAIIIVARDGDTSAAPGERNITVSGSTDAVNKARESITKLLATAGVYIGGGAQPPTAAPGVPYMMPPAPPAPYAVPPAMPPYGYAPAPYPEMPAPYPPYAAAAPVYPSPYPVPWPPAVAYPPVTAVPGYPYAVDPNVYAAAAYTPAAAIAQQAPTPYPPKLDSPVQPQPRGGRGRFGAVGDKRRR